jgi:hypothetical protein
MNHGKYWIAGWVLAAFPAYATVTVRGVPKTLGPGQAVTLEARVTGTEARACHWEVSHDTYALLAKDLEVERVDGSVLIRAPERAVQGAFTLKVLVPGNPSDGATLVIPTRSAKAPTDAAVPDAPALVALANEQLSLRARRMNLAYHYVDGRRNSAGKPREGHDDETSAVLNSYKELCGALKGELHACHGKINKLWQNAKLKGDRTSMTWLLGQSLLALDLVQENETFQKSLTVEALEPTGEIYWLAGRAIELAQSDPEGTAKALERSRERDLKEAEERRLAEAAAKARQEALERTRTLKEERKEELRRTREVFEKSRNEIEGKERVPTPEEEAADREWERIVKDDWLAFHAGRRAGATPRSSSPSSSSSSSTSSSSSSSRPPSTGTGRPGEPVAVEWDEVAEAEDFSEKAVPDPTLRKQIKAAIKELRTTGRLRGTKQVAPKIYEARPCGGQSTWRPLYTWYRGRIFILALTREAQENPSDFKAGLERAQERLQALPRD